MQTFKIHHDIQVACVTAISFPDGIMAAFGKLQNLFPVAENRQHFGISYSDTNAGIVYKAAAVVLNTDVIGKDIELSTIKKGNYVGEDVLDFMNDTSRIGKLFQELLKHPQMDHNGYCLEIYLNDKDVRCMVPLAFTK